MIAGRYQYNLALLEYQGFYTYSIQGSILLEGPVSLLSSVSALGKLLLRSSRHVVYVAWTQVMVVYEIVSHSSITMLP